MAYFHPRLRWTTTIFWKPPFPTAAEAPLLVLELWDGGGGGRRYGQPSARATLAEPPPLALGASHQAVGKVSQGSRNKEGQKIRDGRDNGASPVSHPDTSTW